MHREDRPRERTRMKAGDIVICVDATKTMLESLTEGKEYEILLVEKTMGSSMYTLVNDLGLTLQYYSSRFKTLEEIRDDKLKELGL